MKLSFSDEMPAWSGALEHVGRAMDWPCLPMAAGVASNVLFDDLSLKGDVPLPTETEL